MPFDLASFALGVATALIAALVVHWLTITRDRESRAHIEKMMRESRKSDFFDYATKWKTRVERTNEMGDIAKEFATVFNEFSGQVARIKIFLDKKKCTELDVLSANVSFAGAYVTEQDEQNRALIGRKRLTDAIEAVISFVEKI
jgi:hypothetical protein